jgi:putative ABC transport system permease protein
VGRRSFRLAQFAGRDYEESKRPACFFKIVTPGYFFALGMPIRRGRGLADRDVKGSLPVIVINETFVRRHFPNEDPIGKQVVIEQIITGRRELAPEVPWEVVGIVGDEKVIGLDSKSAGVCVSYAQSPIVGVSLLAKGAGNPSMLIKSIQQAIWRINKNQALPDARPLEQIKSESVAGTRLRTLLLACSRDWRCLPQRESTACFRTSLHNARKNSVFAPRWELLPGT